MKTVLTVFGTRPEVIKLAPVIRELSAQGTALRVVNVTTAQHTDLLYPFVRLFDIAIDHDLHVMQRNQSPNTVCARVLTQLDRILDLERPDLVLLQGDTTSALAGAMAGFHRRIPVGHVEAGLRSGDVSSPFPEEMNRKLISQIASFHFAATARNRDTLLSEGVPDESIFLTGNPVVDALHTVLANQHGSAALEEVLAATDGLRRIVVTTHRRESFGTRMSAHMRIIREFVESHEDAALIFPVHPNPSVVELANRLLGGHDRIHLVRPLEYVDFVLLLARSSLIISDSGGVQEEAPTLGKPVLVIRDTTERPEAVHAGISRLVGEDPQQLASMLDEAWQEESWARMVRPIPNPFGRGDAGKRIALAIAEVLGVASAPALKAA